MTQANDFSYTCSFICLPVYVSVYLALTPDQTKNDRDLKFGTRLDHIEKYFFENMILKGASLGELTLHVDSRLFDCLICFYSTVPKLFSPPYKANGVKWFLNKLRFNPHSTPIPSLVYVSRERLI